MLTSHTNQKQTREEILMEAAIVADLFIWIC